MSKYTLPEMALVPTAQICKSLSNIVSVVSENAEDTITLSNGQSIIVKATSAPYMIMVKQPDGHTFFRDCFVIDESSCAELQVKYVDEIIDDLLNVLINPPEHCIPGAGSIPIIRNSDMFLENLKSSMRRCSKI